MEKLVISSYEEFEKYVGQELGVSDYVALDQERINLFADATLDHQWIHVDTEKAAVESPFKSTIAHGYLTLSMLPYMWNQIIEGHYAFGTKSHSKRRYQICGQSTAKPDPLGNSMQAGGRPSPGS